MQPGKPKEAQGKENPQPDPTPTAAAALALKRGCWEVLGSPSLTELLVSSPTVSPSISRTVPGQMLSGPSMQKSAPSLFVFFFLGPGHTQCTWISSVFLVQQGLFKQLNEMQLLEQPQLNLFV